MSSAKEENAGSDIEQLSNEDLDLTAIHLSYKEGDDICLNQAVASAST